MKVSAGNETYLRLLSLVIVITCFLSYAFNIPVPGTSSQLAYSYAVQANRAIMELRETSQAFKLGRTDLNALRAAVQKARYAYKRTEFILSYYYPEFTDEHINGAPLLHIERNDTRAAVVNPEGLQVLDELTAGNDAENEKVKIAAVAQQLETNYGFLLSGFRTRRIDPGNWLPAIRLQLVRIISLGITGFDTPGSLNALAEARQSLAAMYDILAAHLEERQLPDTYSILPRLKKATAMLSNTDFNDFDRLGFIREHIDPLYADLQLMQRHTPAMENTGWNSNSRHIFSDSFLDPYHYTEITKEEDSKNLRQLGKTLFYDTRLSSNNQLSCASCHQPERAFTDGLSRSASIVKGRTVQRNAPTLLNAVYADRYFYDLRAFSLEQQAEHVIFNQLEFNTAYEEILEKLGHNDEYRRLFKACFGKGTITRDGFSKALSAYVLSLRSFNSPLDKYLRGETDTIDPLAAQGFNLFMGKAACGTCHFAPTFSGLVPPLYTENESEILGIPAFPDSLRPDADEGRAGNKLYSEMAWIHERSFKTTTVRNAALTAPYFHNGAYQTLEQVIDFYDKGGGAGMGMNTRNQTLSADPLHLSAEEKMALITFIHSLNDTSVQ